MKLHLAAVAILGVCASSIVGEPQDTTSTEDLHQQQRHLSYYTSEGGYQDDNMPVYDNDNNNVSTV